MPHSVRFTCLVLLFALIIASGCVATRIQTSWRDQGFYKHFSKIFVICLTKEDIVRTTLENDLSTVISSRGIKAVPSYTVFASLRDVDREAVKRKIREIDADGVLFVRLVRNGLDRGDFDTAYQRIVEDTLTVEVYRTQASLYESTRGTVVWDALSDTIIGGSWIETLKDFSRVIGNNMIDQGII